MGTGRGLYTCGVMSLPRRSLGVVSPRSEGKTGRLKVGRLVRTTRLHSETLQKEQGGIRSGQDLCLSPEVEVVPSRLFSV